jgi:hypothetical protein
VKESSNYPEFRWLGSFEFRTSDPIIRMLIFLLMIDQNRTGSAMHDLRCFMPTQQGSEKRGRPAAGNDQARIDFFSFARSRALQPWPVGSFPLYRGHRRDNTCGNPSDPASRYPARNSPCVTLFAAISRTDRDGRSPSPRTPHRWSHRYNETDR